MALRVILRELAGDIGTRTLEGRVATLLVHHILITSQAREDPCSILMAIEEAPTKRHRNIGLAAGEILHHHFVRANRVNDTSSYGRRQLIVRSSIAVCVCGDVLWSGTHVLHWANHL